MKVKVMQVGPIGTNCYILEDERAKLAAVIDPGDEAEAIQEVVEGTGARVEYILLTHGHYDHTTAVPPCTGSGSRPRSTSTRPTPTGRAAACSPWPGRWRSCTTTARGTPCPWAP